MFWYRENENITILVIQQNIKFKIILLTGWYLKDCSIWNIQVWSTDNVLYKVQIWSHCHLIKYYFNNVIKKLGIFFEYPTLNLNYLTIAYYCVNGTWEKVYLKVFTKLISILWGVKIFSGNN